MKTGGFTIVELLIAAGITMVVAAATFTAMNPARGVFAAQSEAIDMQQGLRVGVDTLATDLLMAGGGAYSGSVRGPLAYYFAPILPHRVGNLSPDRPDQFWADRVTLMYVPATAAQTTVVDPVASSSADVTVAYTPGCPLAPPENAACGFKAGMPVVIMDPAGSWDIFTVTGVQGASVHLQHRGGDLNRAYEAGASISEIVTYTYWLKIDTAAETSQLMRYDGDQVDVPVADNVVGLSFEYYGDPSPPQLRPGSTPPTTYGPKPPGLGVDNPSDLWGAGENCAFTSSAVAQMPRLDWLGRPEDGFVKLTPQQLTDGPWCPDAVSPGRYDADLLRIRRVRVTLRVQAANAASRGSSRSLFVHPGTSTGGERYLPDQEIKFDVTPRNLRFGR
jgi:type II secretory pathway pseudopilin PulG